MSILAAGTPVPAFTLHDTTGCTRTRTRGLPTAPPGFYIHGYLYQGNFDTLAHAIGRVIAWQP